MPAVSVIVPIYNGEKLIHRCIDSILSQTFEDFELIIVDDGSTDSSGQICDEYAQKDSRVVVVHSKNQGVSLARNLGLSKATGEYVAFCDGDDFYKDCLLEHTYKTAIDTGAQVVSFLLERISNEDNLERYDNRLEIYDLNSENRFDFLYKVVTWQTKGWQACRSIFKRQFIEDNNIIFCDTCGNFAEDLGFTLVYLLYTSRIVFLNEYLYCYYDVRENSMMNVSKNVYKVNEVNELSVYLNPIMKDFLTEEQFSNVHYHIINNQTVDMYSAKTMREFKQWHKLLTTLNNTKYFKVQNTKYYVNSIQTQLKKANHPLMKYFLSKRAIIVHYLSDLNLRRLRRDILINSLVCKLIKKT